MFVCLIFFVRLIMYSHLCLLTSVCLCLAGAVNSKKNTATKSTPLALVFGLDPRPSWEQRPALPEGTVSSSNTGVDDIKLQDLAHGKTGELGQKAVQLLLDQGCPKLTRVGVSGKEHNCAVLAALLAANEVVGGRAIRSYRNEAKQVEAALSYRHALSANVTAQQLLDAGVSEEKHEQLREELSGNGSLGKLHLAVVGEALKYNIFILETTQVLNAEEHSAEVSLVLANPSFKPERESMLLEARCTQVAEEEPANESGSETKTSVNVGGHFGLLEDIKGARKWDCRNAVTKVSVEE
jgi:hypothetical protein